MLNIFTFVMDPLQNTTSVLIDNRLLLFILLFYFLSIYRLVSKLLGDGRLTKLDKYENSFLVRTDPKDVARVESRTFMCTNDRSDSVPTPAEGVKGTLGNWADASSMKRELQNKFSDCMTGRTMYVIPFSMGPVGSPLSKIGTLSLLEIHYKVIPGVLQVFSSLTQSMWYLVCV